MYSLDPVPIVLILVVLLPLAYGAVWYRRIRAREAERERGAEEGADAVSDPTVDDQLPPLRKSKISTAQRIELLQLAETTEQQIASSVEEALFRASEAERREEELRGVIRGICGERDEWRRLYYDQATGHDNAQIWLERDLNRLGQLFQAVTGQPAPSPLPATKEARKAFLAAHGEAIEEWRKRKSKPDKPLVPENSTPAED